ncbi:MAG: glycosyl transferase family protein [Chloroflexi bacterium OLB15]|nr:MAG: glycosyl transferase family protein [Chloroflexi bacterium OLB15]
MPYWISATLAATPAFLWVYLGLGIPLALALLPRHDWGDWLEVGAVSIFTGAALLSIWMFALGTLGAIIEQPLMQFPIVLLGTVIAAALAGLVASKRRKSGVSAPRARWALDEILVSLLVAAALVVRWVVIAFWPFTAYDTLWVYGYLGRLFFQEGLIPNSIGYYPQYLPLQYTFGQMAVGGIDDHAARAGLLLLHLATILATYVLGARLFNRRTGLYAAAIWALYPHVGEWSRAGDLEILIAGLFALASAYFVAAWVGQTPRRWYAALSGLMLGIGLWSKPTMGAFIWGLALLGVIELLRTRLRWQAAWPRLQLILIAGCVALPVGAVWYIRNLILGHTFIVLPSSFWLSIAARSGAEFGWPLLALAIYIAYIYLKPLRPFPSLKLLLPGLLLIGAGVAPSILTPRPIAPLEWAVLLAGAVLTGWALILHARLTWDDNLRRDGSRLGWVLLLALPYFVTWFFSYSYHYRLSFSIVPLLILPCAYFVARWYEAASLKVWIKPAFAAVAIILAVPGIISAVPDPTAGANYLFDDSLPDDRARYTSGNAALMNVAAGLQAWLDQHPDETIHVSAPGILRLPFFFPDQSIDVTSVPTRLEQLRDTEYFVYGVPETQGAYGEIPFVTNQVVGSFGRQDVFPRVWGMDDGNFRYDVYEPHLSVRETEVTPLNAETDEVIFGGFVRYLGNDIGGLELWPGRRIIAHLYWQPIAPADGDYSIFIHLVDLDGNLITTWDGPVGKTPEGTYYSTLVWEPGETISDERVFLLPDGVAPVGEGYRIVIGIYDALSNQRLAATVNGESAGDSYTIEDRMVILNEAP